MVTSSYCIAFTNSLNVQCIRFMYDTAGVLANNIRLRLHIGLKSRVDDLENDSIRLLDDTAEVSDPTDP